MRTRPSASVVLFLSALSFWYVVPAFAQSSEETGRLKVHVEPKQAYVFVDGKAIRDGSQTIHLAAGDHQVGVYNYGYEPKTENVQIDAPVEQHRRAGVSLKFNFSERSGYLVA